MTVLDYLKAVAVAITTLVFTIAASFPMVAVYAFLIEPGHEQAFYTDAAQWIAPWSSHILGPITFFALNYWLARKSPERNAILFAVSTIIAYLFIDLGIVIAIREDIAFFLTLEAIFWVVMKLAGALLGAQLGKKIIYKE